MTIKPPETEEAFIEIDPLMQCLIGTRRLLMLPRGRFYPYKDFGSRLHEVAAPINTYALAYAQQALAETDGIHVIQAEQQGKIIQFTLLINNTEGKVNYRID